MKVANATAPTMKIFMGRKRSHPYCIGAANRLLKSIPVYDERESLETLLDDEAIKMSALFLGLVAQDHRRVAEETGAGPYDPVFAVLMGEELPPSSEGFSADYDGRFRVVGVDRLAPLSSEDCPTS